MPFVANRSDEQEFLQMQADLPDRTAGLVWPILIDRRLRATIEGRWKDDSKGDVLRNLFEVSGPLGDAGARVRVGFAIGLYDEDMFSDLKLVVNIRNSFAHEPGVHSFDDSPIQDHVGNFRLVDKYPKGPIALIIPPSGMDRETWMNGLLCSSGLIDLEPRRTRFLRVIEIVLTWLAIEAGEFEYAPSPTYRPPPGLLTGPST